MTEFNAQVGSAYVSVGLNTDAYKREFAAFKAQAARDEKSVRMNVGVGMGGGAGGGGGGPAWNPGGARVMAPTAAQQAAAQQAGGAVGGGNLGGPGAGPNWQPGGGNYTMSGQQGGGTGARASGNGGYLGRVVAPVAIAHASIATTEALAGFASATMAATRQMKFASSNAERVNTRLQFYSDTQSAIGRIPFVGGLANAEADLMLSAMGQSPADIKRIQAEADRTNSLNGAATSGALSNRSRTAKARAGMFPNGNLDLEMKSAAEDFQIKKMDLSDRRQAVVDAHQEATSPAFTVPSMVVGSGTMNALLQAQMESQNVDIRQRRNVALKPLDAEAGILAEEKKAVEVKLQFASDSLKLQMESRKQVAQLTTQQKFASADVAKRWGEYQQELRSTPEQLKKQFTAMSLAESQAERQGMLTEVGRREATEVDVSRTIVGDPRGLRHLTDPLESLNTHMQNLLTGEPRLLLGR